jgi:hypothetical protein
MNEVWSSHWAWPSVDRSTVASMDAEVVRSRSPTIYSRGQKDPSPDCVSESGRPVDNQVPVFRSEQTPVPF